MEKAEGLLEERILVLAKLFNKTFFMSLIKWLRKKRKTLVKGGRKVIVLCAVLAYLYKKIVVYYTKKLIFLLDC